MWEAQPKKLVIQCLLEASAEQSMLVTGFSKAQPSKEQSIVFTVLSKAQPSKRHAQYGIHCVSGDVECILTFPPAFR